MCRHLQLPGNVLYYISKFKKLATFEIFPSKTVIKAVFFQEDPETNDLKVNNLEMMGYQFKNMIMNMGMFFLIILFLIVLAIAMRVAKCFRLKYKV